ncbi:uncharacterized protein LOC122025280 isoform X2 [Zingiber officinale]|uniref:uncharacterized protein LOC122025280 isoform X2 n=1 Tax=Zingiber officinale TaxID=94328 RepID=UPI001C4C9886|nr:uncharacterized protein LOC122025280 isoform X2 [Zingiber officinale]
MENGEESFLVNPEKLDDDDEVLRFLDSLDAYLRLRDSVSSMLRQGWFELATARHSMGSSRVSSVVLDQKVQPAATTLQVRESVSELQPFFSLSKWSSSAKDGICSSEEIELSSMQTTVKDSELRHRGTSSFYDDMKKINSTINLTPTDSDSNHRFRRKGRKCYQSLGLWYPQSFVLHRFHSRQHLMA